MNCAHRSRSGSIILKISTVIIDNIRLPVISNNLIKTICPVLLYKPHLALKSNHFFHKTLHKNFMKNLMS